MDMVECQLSEKDSRQPIEPRQSQLRTVISGRHETIRQVRKRSDKCREFFKRYMLIAIANGYQSQISAGSFAEINLESDKERVCPHKPCSGSEYVLVLMLNIFP